MPLSLTQKLWLRGLIAAFVSGGAGAVTTAVTAPLFAPNDLNFGGHPWKLLGMMATTFLITGLIGACGYLKQSPVPIETITTTVEAKTEVTTSKVAGQ